MPIAIPILVGCTKVIINALEFSSQLHELGRGGEKKCPDFQKGEKISFQFFFPSRSSSVKRGEDNGGREREEERESERERRERGERRERERGKRERQRQATSTDFPCNAICKQFSTFLFTHGVTGHRMQRVLVVLLEKNFIKWRLKLYLSLVPFNLFLFPFWGAGRGGQKDHTGKKIKKKI